MRNIVLPFALMCAIGLTFNSAYANGEFKGELVLKVTDDARKLTVANRFSFVDSDGDVWIVPAGMKTDGASVPRVAWSLFPPFAGKYLKAAVVHDRYCDTKQKTWQATHRVFYDAMVVAGVDNLSAKTMYAAVRSFGPRWSVNGKKIRSGKFLSQEEKLTDLVKLQDWIEKNNPSLEEIEERSDGIN